LGNASAFSADPRLRLATWPVRHCYIACASFSLLNLGRDVRLIRGVNFSTLSRLTSQSTTRMTQKSLILNCKAISEYVTPSLSVGASKLLASAASAKPPDSNRSPARRSPNLVSGADL